MCFDTSLFPQSVSRSSVCRYDFIPLFADTTLFLAISSIVATLDIGKARDANGQIIMQEETFYSAFVR